MAMKKQCSGGKKCGAAAKPKTPAKGKSCAGKSKGKK